jgi:hypothetical protein
MAFLPKHARDNRLQKPDLRHTRGTTADHAGQGTRPHPDPAEWRTDAQTLRQIAVRLTHNSTHDAVAQVAALIHVADALEAEADVEEADAQTETA